MKLKSYSDSAGVKYVPKYGNNHDAEEEDQMHVVIIPLSNKDMMKQRSALLRTQFRSAQNGSVKEASNAAIEQQRKTFINRVTEIHNCEIEIASKDGQTRVISNPTSEELYDFAPPPLVEEILGVINDASLLDEEKKMD